MSGLYYGLGDKLSNTDPINNSVLISGLHFERDGVNLLRPGRYPIASLGSYIHEYLHHHCFRMPVGEAIACLYHRAFLRAFDYVALEHESSFDDLHVCEEIVRVETILHVMRPLAEGIALFGEFDTWLGESKSLSVVFRHAAVAFAEAVPHHEDLLISEVLSQILVRARLRPAMRMRKENLLMQGFTTRGGGYLPGYFLVKNLQVALFGHTKSELLLDSEFYLNFLVNWFYNDHRLIEALIDSDKEIAPLNSKSIVERDSVNAITVAFQERVSDLFRLTADQIQSFDDISVSEPVVPWNKLQIGMSAAEATKIEDKLCRLIDEVVEFDGADMSLEQRAARFMCRDSFVRRKYMCLGSFNEPIEIKENGRVLLAKSSVAEGVPVMSFGESEKAGPFSGEANFDVLQSAYSQKVFFTVHADGQRVTLQTMADNFEEERDRLACVDLSTVQCQLTKAIMRETIDRALGPEEPGSTLRDHYRRQADRTADAMYRNWCGALMGAAGEEADIPAEQGALLEMCDRDLTFLRTIAALGCSGPWLLRDADIQRACNSTGLAVDRFFARAEVARTRHKLRFVRAIGRYALLTI